MKPSNIFATILLTIILASMVVANSSLKAEFEKIDLDDKYKNYASVSTDGFTVLDIRGSNGYPIEISGGQTNDVKVLRSRMAHFKKQQVGDTLFIEFSGANIPLDQSFENQTPPGILITSSDLRSIISSNTYTRIKAVNVPTMSIVLNDASTSDLAHCTFDRLSLNSASNSRFLFSTDNSIDSMFLDMRGNSIGRFNDVDFNYLDPVLGDSIAMVLSGKVFSTLQR